MNDSAPIRVAVTGAAGQIGYSLLFRIASGAVFGPDQPVALNLVEIEPGMKALEGVVMELDDCAFPLLKGVRPTSDLDEGFGAPTGPCSWEAFPARPGWRGRLARHQRQDLYRTGPGHPEERRFRRPRAGGREPLQHQLPDRHEQCSRRSPRGWFAMTRLDENRAAAQLAAKAGVQVSEVSNVTIWGNHSATQYPDYYNAGIGGTPAPEVISDDTWAHIDFIPTVQQRGAAIIEARGASSAASAANAAIDTVAPWSTRPPRGLEHPAWPPTEATTPGRSHYLLPRPFRWERREIVQDVPINDFAREKIDASVNELAEERDWWATSARLVSLPRRRLVFLSLMEGIFFACPKPGSK